MDLHLVSHVHQDHESSSSTHKQQAMLTRKIFKITKLRAEENFWWIGIHLLQEWLHKSETDHLQLVIMERGDQGLIRATKGDDRFSHNCKICDYIKLSKIYLIMILMPLLLCAGIYLVFQFERNSNKANMPFGCALKLVDKTSCKPSIYLYDICRTSTKFSLMQPIFA